MIRGPYSKPNLNLHEPPPELTAYYAAGADLVEFCGETMPRTSRALHLALLRGDREQIDSYCLLVEGAFPKVPVVLVAFYAASGARDAWMAEARREAEREGARA